MSRRRLVGIVLVVALVAAAVVALVVPATRMGPATGGENAVALIELSGPIQEGPVGLTGAAITPSIVRDRLEAAAENPRVGAVVVRVQSGGGAVAASQEIAGLIADHPQPVVISMADQAASGGYYISARAERVVAQPGTLTGSIGVIITRFDPTELLNELGVQLEVIHTGKHKDMFIPGRLNDEERQLLQDISDDLYDQFVTTVAEGRDLSESKVRDLATGEVYTGADALDLGLVDKLGGVETAVETAADLAEIDEPQVVELQGGVLQQLFGGGGFAGGLRQLVAPRLTPKELLARQLLRNWGTPQYRHTPLRPEMMR